MLAHDILDRSCHWIPGMQTAQHASFCRAASVLGAAARVALRKEAPDCLLARIDSGPFLHVTPWIVNVIGYWHSTSPACLILPSKISRRCRGARGRAQRIASLTPGVRGQRSTGGRPSSCRMWTAAAAQHGKLLMRHFWE